MAPDDLRRGARFLRRLPGYLRRRVGVAEAHATLERRLREREARFLGLLRRTVDEHPPGPYRALLRHAGCEHGDLVGLVRREGIEGPSAGSRGTASTSRSRRSRAGASRAAWTSTATAP